MHGRPHLCRVIRTISLSLWFNKCLVNLFSLQQHLIHLIIAIKSSSYFRFFWLWFIYHCMWCTLRELVEWHDLIFVLLKCANLNKKNPPKFLNDFEWPTFVAQCLVKNKKVSCRPNLMNKRSYTGLSWNRLIKDQ